MSHGVVVILDRAERLSSAEAEALNLALRDRPELVPDALYAMGEHERFLNHCAMFDHWSHPWDEMVEAHRRVAKALGVRTIGGGGSAAFPEDDGSIAWGASMAAALAALPMGNATADLRFREPWDQVIRP